MSRKVLVNAGDGGEFGGEAEAAPPERSSCPAFGLLEAGGWRPARVRRTGDGGEFMGVRAACTELPGF
ncbi:hypothetical protein E4U56_001437 [Claviceps arundinis]|uniref:Uncharacterized protein n=1 Tax=Claviceps arundinis TaxID=1623583 RepID=A0A9P7N0E8_9HYPO|nr:hypothetical protein E4U56_001437 [Claviceps arundinis]